MSQTTYKIIQYPHPFAGAEGIIDALAPPKSGRVLFVFRLDGENYSERIHPRNLAPLPAAQGEGGEK